VRKMLAALAVVSALVVASPGVAFAKAPSEISKCVTEKVEAKQPQLAEDCVNAPSPILPATNEIIWGALSFIVLLAALTKFALPAVRKMMEARTERIRTNLDEAERVKGEAQSLLDDYQRQLADARAESGRIIEEARQTADAMRRDLMARAEADAAEARQRSQADIDASIARAEGELRQRVAELAIELAEMVVQRSLDRDSQMQLVNSYIDELQSQTQAR
jgi:F-type H+-transporting ATPase subunit b